MKQLRPYQREAIDAITEKFKRSDNALLVMVMGLGKSFTSFSFIKETILRKPTAKFHFVVNRKELLEQMERELITMFPAHWIGVYTGGRKKVVGRAITVGTIQSLVRAKLSVDVVILDEVHNLSSDNDSQYKKYLKQCAELNPHLKVLGMSATPFRADGLIYGKKNSLFDSITYEKDLKWALANGMLVIPRMKKPEEQFDTENLNIVRGDFDQKQIESLSNDLDKIKAQVKDALPRLEGRKKVVWACTCIKHAEDLAQILRDESEDAVAYHSKTEDRSGVMTKWKSSGRHLTFISIIKEGFDFPPIDAVCLCCPTRSPVKYMQIAGRALRLYEGKEDALILDYGAVVENCGPLDNPRIPKKGEKNSKLPDMTFCPQCLEYISKLVPQCPCCGFQIPKVEIISDRTKNLLTRHSNSFDILSSDRVRSAWVKIKDVVLEDYTTSSGKPSTKIKYIPDNAVAVPIVEYCVWDNAFTNKMAFEKLKKIGVTAFKQDQIRNQKPKVPSYIKVVFEKFPRVEEVKYDENGIGEACEN